MPCASRTPDAFLAERSRPFQTVTIRCASSGNVGLTDASPRAVVGGNSFGRSCARARHAFRSPREKPMPMRLIRTAASAHSEHQLAQAVRPPVDNTAGLMESRMSVKSAPKKALLATDGHGFTRIGKRRLVLIRVQPRPSVAKFASAEDGAQASPLGAPKL